MTLIIEFWQHCKKDLGGLVECLLLVMLLILWLLMILEKIADLWKASQEINKNRRSAKRELKKSAQVAKPEKGSNLPLHGTCFHCKELVCLPKPSKRPQVWSLECPNCKKNLRFDTSRYHDLR